MCSRTPKGCSSGIQHTLLLSTPAKILGRKGIGSRGYIYTWIHVTYVFQEWVVVHSCEACAVHVVMWTISLQTKVTAFGGGVPRGKCVADRLELYLSVKLRCVLCRLLFSENAPISSKVKAQVIQMYPPALELHLLVRNTWLLWRAWFYFGNLKWSVWVAQILCMGTVYCGSLF